MVAFRRLDRIGQLFERQPSLLFHDLRQVSLVVVEIAETRSSDAADVGSLVPRLGVAPAEIGGVPVFQGRVFGVWCHRNDGYPSVKKRTRSFGECLRWFVSKGFSLC